MTNIELLFDKMQIDSLFSDRVIKCLRDSLCDESGVYAFMLVGCLESLQGFYNVKRKFPKLSEYVHYNELIQMIESKIRDMETHTAVQHLLEKFNCNEEIDIT
jgi:hypothetical protein